MASKKYHSSRLAAHIGTMHLETMHYLDKQAEKAAKSIDRAIVAILELTKRKPPLPQYQLEIEITRILDKLPNDIGQAVYDSLIKAGKRSAVNTVKALIKSLPLEYLPVGIAASGLNINARIIQKPKRKPAFILTPTELKVRIHHLLIDPIEKETLQKIVLGGAKNISALMRQAKRQLNYRKVARILIDGTSKGKSYRQLQRDLQQELGITRSQAKRIARTEGARVSTESNFASYDKLGTAVIGFMIHATPNPDSRYWHRERSGTIYYKNPGPGQKGLRQMPKPPMEAEDPAERPPDAPQLASNCLCFISAVFQPLDNLKPNLVHNVDGTVVPDVLTYADWFQTQPERMKRKAVGSKRFDAVTKKHGDNAGYQYFVHPEDGRLLTLPEIAAETAQETSQRVALVNKITMERRRERRDVLLWGSVQ